MRRLALFSSLSVVVLAATGATSSALNCTNLRIPVKAQALNKQLDLLDLSNLFDPKSIGKILAAVNSLPTTLVQGEYTIDARYCAPLQDIPQRANTLQVLVHGITYNKDYWSGPSTRDIGPGSTEESWVYYAASQGYATLAIDRLCNGKSSRPNGLLECQIPLEGAVQQAVIQKVRSGGITGIPTKYSKIVYVGHSYGSLVGNYMAGVYPEAFDQAVFTGFSDRLAVGIIGILVRPLFLPANIVAPLRFPGLDGNYLLGTLKEGARPCFYVGDYDEDVVDYQWQTRGTVTAGETATSLVGQLEAKEFEGHVIVLNGDGDNIFCSLDPASALAGSPGQCTAGNFARDVKASYPKAQSFQSHNVPNTGHCILAQRTAASGVRIAHDMLASNGF